jgi:flagellar protein FliJ
MKPDPQITHLIEMATADRDGTAKHLGVCVRQMDESMQRLELLQRYRTDYAARFEGRSFSIEALGNLNRFVAKLDVAIGEQQKDVEIRQRVAAHAQGALIEAEKRVQSYKTLAQRRLAAHNKREAKREQKQMDDFAARIAQSGLAFGL